MRLVHKLHLGADMLLFVQLCQLAVDGLIKTYLLETILKRKNKIKDIVKKSPTNVKLSSRVMTETTLARRTN